MLRHLAIVMLLVAAARAAERPATDRPNILYILADDLGYGDVSTFNPQSAWPTPHLDRLAREGIAFTNAHSASSLCTPSRYALLTGRYAWRGALKQGVLQGYGAPLIETNRPTVARFLRDHGYTTAMFGKWHLGLEWAHTGLKPEDVDFAKPVGGGPLAHGFDRFFGLSASLDMPPYVWIQNDRATAIPTATVGDSPAPKLFRAGPIALDFKMEEVQPRLTEKAIAYLTERGAAHDGKPFFLYLPLAAPHTPILPTREFEGKTHVTSYGDFVTQVDADVGRILAALEASGLAKNTLVIFTSDNGFAPAANVPEHAKFHHDPSGGLRGYKSDLFEGGHRIPFIARWPGVTPAGTRCADPIEQLDLFATCAELLGVTMTDGAEDSMSMAAILRTGKPAPASRTTVVSHSGEGRFAITEGNWKLLLWPGSGGWSPPTPNPSQWLKTDATDLSTLPPFQLYDLATDPDEKNNLAAAHPEIVQRLGRLMLTTLEQGRSTAGAPQPYVRPENWEQIGWSKAFAK
jgi:arylsulfatase A